jgi:hypothetical protein
MVYSPDKNYPGTNTLAYFAAESVTNKKVFIKFSRWRSKKGEIFSSTKVFKLGKCFSITIWRHDIHHNDAQHNDIQHNRLNVDNEHNDTRHKH